PPNRMIGEIPRGRVRAGMAKDHNPPEPPRPLVEVLLLREPSRLDAVVAPFQAAVAPPLEACHAVRVAAARDPADVIAAVPPERLQRPVERETPGQVVAVKISAEMPHHAPFTAARSQERIHSVTVRACESVRCGCIGRLTISRQTCSVWGRPPGARRARVR